MPEQPPPKRQPRSARPPLNRRFHCRLQKAGYAELHCKTNFSFLQGASHPDELVQRASKLDYAALAITDRNSLAGIVRAHVASKDVGLKLLIGAEITPVDAPPVILLATDRAAYGRLARLITRGRRNAPKGECRLTVCDVAEYADGLLACVPMQAIDEKKARGKRQQAAGNRQQATGNRQQATGKRQEATGKRQEARGNRQEGEDLAICSTVLPQTEAPSPQPSALDSRPSTHLNIYREVFGNRCYGLAELHCGANDQWLLQRMLNIARETRVPLVAANDVHYHIPERRMLQDVLTAIRAGCPVAELGNRMFANGERYLKPVHEMLRLFADVPSAVERAREIADRCQFSLDELRYEYPEELCPSGQTPIVYLTQLAWRGARQRYPHAIPEKVRRLIEHELQLIEQLHYEAYFLTVWDLVQFARRRGILCQGRGSAANSAVCYCLGITSVDPNRIDVLFERFVSKERDEAPDIDVDFEHERREEVIQYIYEKYGRERAGMTAEIITYQSRSAVRDVGKALGLSLDRVDTLAKGLEHFHEPKQLAQRCREAGLNPESRIGRQLIALVQQLIGFPRHLSQHVGGMVMTRKALCELVPIENAAMPDRTVIQWDKDDLDALGILKVDCLSLGMLTAIHKCFDLISSHEVECLPRLSDTSRVSTDSQDRRTLRLTLANIPAEDPQVYEMISQADTMGVFQIESRAQMSMLPRLQPRCFYDLVIEVAIVRPGPIQGDMVHPYLRRRNGEEPVEFPDERIRTVLQKTLGVPIFQEQAMRLAVVAAGFTPGEADQLRRAMGAWRRPGVIDRFRQKLIDGLTTNGYASEFAERVFRQIRGFGEYGFPESHAASFALLVYVSAWLKRYYPAAFTASLLNSQPMGFYAPAQLVANARKHSVEVRPVDVNFSDWDCTLEPVDCTKKLSVLPRTLALRLGFRMLRGLSGKHAQILVQKRKERPFQSFEDFACRTGLSNTVLKTLSKADAFCSLHLNRRESLWESLPQRTPMPLFEQKKAVPCVRSSPQADPQNETRPHFALSAQEEVAADYQAMGLSLRAHPLKFLREELKSLQAVCASDLSTLPSECRIKVAGLVLLRQRPSTANGITFVTLEDETGIANLIIRPNVWDRNRQIIHRANAILVWGELQRKSNVIHVLVSKIEDLSARLNDLRLHSRDFR